MGTFFSRYELTTLVWEQVETLVEDKEAQRKLEEERVKRGNECHENNLR